MEIFLMLKKYKFNLINLILCLTISILIIVVNGCGQSASNIINQDTGNNNYLKTTTTTSTTIISTSTTLFKTTTTFGSGSTTSTTTKLVTTTLRPELQAPTGLQAVCKDSSVLLSWLASTSSNVSGYKVYRMKIGDTEFCLLATLGCELNYIDSTVENGQIYIYTVKSYNTGQESDFSVASVINYIVIDETPPAAPVNLIAEPETTTVSLSWQSNFESDLAGYNLYCKIEGGSIFYKVNSTPVVSTYYFDTALAANTLYAYRITAVDKSGNESAPSTAVEIRTLVAADIGPPSAPTGLNASASEYQVSLSWSSNLEADFHHYNLYRVTKSLMGEVLSQKRVTNLYGTGYLDTDVSNGTTYYYQLSTVDNSGNESLKSAEIAATPVSSIDDDAVIRAQLSKYEQGMKTQNIVQVMSTISNDYLDTYYIMGSTYYTHRDDFQTSLQSSFQINNYPIYNLTITGITITNRAAIVTAKIEAASEGKKTTDYDYTGAYATALVFEKYFMTREGDSWLIIRDKTEKAIGFETMPITYKTGYNLIYQALILAYDNNCNISSYLQLAFAQDPSGNVINFTSGYLGLISYATVEAGDYTTAVVLTDKAGTSYNLSHHYKVFPKVSSSGISSLSATSNNDYKWIKYILGLKWNI